jgi:hypothetical protein
VAAHGGEELGAGVTSWMPSDPLIAIAMEPDQCGGCRTRGSGHPRLRRFPTRGGGLGQLVGPSGRGPRRAHGEAGVGGGMPPGNPVVRVRRRGGAVAAAVLATLAKRISACDRRALGIGAGTKNFGAHSKSEPG